MMGLAMIVGVAVFAALVGVILRLFTTSKREVKRKNDELFAAAEDDDDGELVEFIPTKAKRGMPRND